MLNDAIRHSIEEAQLSEQEPRPLHFRMFGLQFVLLRDVFSPLHFGSTEFLTAALPVPTGSRFLDMGCGAGVTSVVVAKRGAAQVVGIDISRFAARNAMENALLNGCADKVSIVVGDLFSTLDEGTKFDVIFWNSNFVRAPEGYPQDRWWERALLDPGYATHRQFLETAPRYLSSGGRLLLGFSDLGDAGWLRDKCEELRYQPKILVEKSGIEGPGTAFQLIDLGIGSKR